ncbi:MAG: SpoIID/LytB domain-containing protein, partial [Patescibacteria group bacterium]
MRLSFGILAAALFVTLALPADLRAATPALLGRVNEAFEQAFGEFPTPAESLYWQKRVASGEKKTYDALLGAMYYQKAIGRTVGEDLPINGKTSAKAPSPATSESKTQLIKDVLPIFIQIFGNDPTNTEKAWWRKRISCNEIKTKDALIKSMNFHKSKKVRKGSDAICGQVAARPPSGVTSKEVLNLGGHVLGDLVRIGIYGTNGSAITVAVNSQYHIRSGSETLATLGKDDEVKVSWSGGNYHVRGSGLEIDAEEPVRITPVGGGIVQIKSYNDKSKTIADKNYNRFRGIVEIRKCTGCGELWAVNEIRTEQYLRGLAETSGEGPEEYIKALGIAARTYVLYHKAVTGGRSHARGYDIGRTADDQIYRGYEYEIITSRMASIFNQVRGI